MVRVGKQGTAALAVTAGAFGSLDSALNIAFPDLSDHFGLSVSGLQWVVVCFVLAYGGPLLAAGQLADRFGHRRMLTFGAIIALVAMTVCATAPTFGIFLGGRILQGVGTALVMAAAPALVTLGQPAGTHGAALGRFQTAAAVGLAAGPIVGGPLVALGGWPAVFWFRVPLAMLLGWLAVTTADPPAPADSSGAGSKTDVTGGVLFTVALIAALLAANGGRALGWTSPVVLGAVVITALAIGLIPRTARRAVNPVLDPALFHSPAFVAAAVLAVVANGAVFVTWLLMPTLLVDRIGWGVLGAGLVLACSPAATAAVAPLAGRRADRGQGHQLVVGGLALEAAGLGLLGFAAGADSNNMPTSALIVTGMVAAGAGLGLFVVPNMATIMGALPRSSQGVAGGLSLLTRTTGIVAAVGASSALFDALEPQRGWSFAFRTVYWSMTILLTATAIGVLAARNILDEKTVDHRG